MTICNSDGEVIGVVQAINKNPMGTPFTEDDEKVRLDYVSQLEVEVTRGISHSHAFYWLFNILYYCSWSGH